MSVIWSETALEICTDALQHLGVIGAGETPSAEDMQPTLRGLNAVLKDLPLYGYTWPKLSAEAALAWISGQTIDLPDDYYGNAIAWKTVNSQKQRLIQIPHADWVQMTGRDQTGTVTHFYIDNAHVLYLYPVPTVDPVITIQYQVIVNDAELTVTPDVLQTWKYPLGYGVANEVALKFYVPQERRLEVAARWEEKRRRALRSTEPDGPIVAQVAE